MKQRDDWHLTDELDYEQGRGDPFAAAVRATRMPMVITDPGQRDNPIVFCNVAFQELTGYAREEIIGKNCRFLQGPETDPEAVARVKAAIESGHDIDIDLLNYRKDGSTFWNALYLSPVCDDHGEIRFFLPHSSMSLSGFRFSRLSINRRCWSNVRSRGERQIYVTPSKPKALARL